MAYQAIVARIKTFPHPNANKIQLGKTQGYQVVVSLNTNDNELGVFFPSEGQLSDEFCTANNLYPILDDQNNKIGGGFIDKKNRRVRAQNFREEKSEGFWVPLSYLEYTGISLSSLKEGDMFTSINNRPICNKYISEATKRIKKDSKTSKKIVVPQLPMHLDTKQLFYYHNKIPRGSQVYITEKIHGTSGRTANAKVNRKPKWWEKVLMYFGVSIDLSEYKIVTGSRRVTKLDNKDTGWYGDDSFRKIASDMLAPYLREGEAIYYEIVGYTTTGKKIQPDSNPSDFSKAFSKTWGDKMEWTYNADPCTFKIFIYDWALITETGTKFNFPWEYIVARAKEIQDPVIKLVPSVQTIKEYEEKNNFLEVVQELAEKPSESGNCYQEGVCLRIEKNGHLWDILKYKTLPFRMMEQQKVDDAPNIEEIS